MEEIISLKFGVLQNEFNERQRRLWAASEALCLGHGGVTLVSRATGLSRTTINNGITELEQGRSLSGQRVRRKGGGRKKVTDQQPALVETLDGLVEPTAKGDPISPLRWTVHSTRRLAAHRPRSLSRTGMVRHCFRVLYSVSCITDNAV